MSTRPNLIAATHTPFDARGELNLIAVERQAELLIESGVSGVFPGGTTGESLSLTTDERMSLAKRWVDVAAGTSLRVVIHVGHNALPDAIALARQAEQIGADAISAMPPCYFRPETVEDLVECMREVAGAAPSLPFYYYDIPPMTNVRLSMVEFAARAAGKIPNLSGIKYSNMDLVQLQELLCIGELEILFGCDEALLSAWALGVRGAVGSTYNFAMPLYLDLLAAFERRDLETARRRQLESVRLVRRLQRDGFLPASKALVGMLGADCGACRKPLRTLTTSQLKSLYDDLRSFDAFPRTLTALAATTTAGRV